MKSPYALLGFIFLIVIGAAIYFIGRERKLETIQTPRVLELGEEITK